ncbi:uncharacterized protein LOC120850563 [Ixodes scapularis]|uniref:uncharacterized protein LOC120850563 n=1 Tax=Ixodes scapularis TaxID=6945 RepID=UPI001A9E25C8|nr:uncharacterized protein LOC120850563 [Ixodes scapularis]
MLGDAGYPLQPWLMAPFRKPRKQEEENYNECLTKTRQVIERTYGILKSRFRCLDRSGGVLQYTPIVCGRTSVACAVLHNYCIRHHVSLADPPEHYRRTLGFVTHLSRDLPPEAFRNLYTALVLPQLEFCWAIWGPLQQSRQNALASIQRRAAFTFYRRSTPRSSLLSYRDVSTDSLLRNANWRSLQHRRDVASIRLFCRGMSADDMDCPNIPRLNRRSGRLQPVLARTLRHRRTCLLRAAELWLALPPELTAVIPKDRDSIKELCQLISRQDGWHL